MTNRMLSVLFAAAVTCLALAFNLQRKSQVARENTELSVRPAQPQPQAPKPNIAGYSFSKN